jgi:hypothetical protein
MRDIGCVGHLVEALHEILAHGAERGGGDEEQEDDGAYAPAGPGRAGAFAILHGQIGISTGIILRGHGASVHGGR